MNPQPLGIRDPERLAAIESKHLKEWRGPVKNNAFRRRMRAMQVELITEHFPRMDATTKARAIKTLAWLQNGAQPIGSQE